MPTHHELFASPKTVHWGYFDARVAPVLAIESGDTVTLTSVSGGRNILPPDGNGMVVLPEHLDIHARHTAELGPHILTGPIHVAEAKPGDTLEVRIKEIEPRQNWAYNTLRGGALPEDFGNMHRPIQIAIDLETKTAHPPWGGQIPLSPFFGNMGTAPAPARGRVSSAPPGEFGGNMDIKDFVAGSILYLPVFNDGALFSMRVTDMAPRVMARFARPRLRPRCAARSNSSCARICGSVRRAARRRRTGSPWRSIRTSTRRRRRRCARC
jgi:acetamidase/formamidase